MSGGYSVVVAGTTITASRENQYVSRQVVTRHASASARNSAISTAAEEGMYADLADTDALTRYNGSTWVDAVNTQIFTPVRAVAAAAGTTNSITYTSTLTGVGTALSTTFVAKCTTHCVTVGALMTISGSGPWVVYMAPVVTGSGFTTYGPSDDDAAHCQPDDSPATGAYVERTTIVPGLTPGVTYTVTPQFRSMSTAGTASFASRTIIVR